MRLRSQEKRNRQAEDKSRNRQEQKHLKLGLRHFCFKNITVNYLFPIFIYFFNNGSVVRRIEIRNAPYEHLFIIIIRPS